MSEVDGSRRSRTFQHLVVVGASAGGIEALSAFVIGLPAKFAAPIVIAQHISRTHVSTLPDILARRSPLPVRTVTGEMPLEPGVIFVVPPNRDVVITDHAVSIQEDDGQGPRPSVDVLFRSGSRIFGEDLIAVILSGSGSDGAAGAREVKQAGGTIVVQNPETASFPSMPLSLASSIVDIVTNPERIGQVLHDLISGNFTVDEHDDDRQLKSFLQQLRDDSGIDFTAYKQPTILRRLQRRMASTDQATLTHYTHYLRLHPDERQRLIASFLIKVTEFFRDDDLFTYLRRHLLPELIADARSRNAELRLWSAGCATGEEAYSLAMLVSELIDGDDGDQLPVRIFATDLDAEAVAFARQGIYPERALKAVPTATVNRYFTEHDGEYEVKKTLRSLVVFGEHDLGQRAPFPRIDLILCRNVLIYFTPALQRRALQLFGFSLRTGGYLGLGKSESVNPLAEHFAVDQPRLKVFRRVGARSLIPAARFNESLPTSTTAPPVGRLSTSLMNARADRSGSGSRRSQGNIRGEQVVSGLPVGVVLVDRNYDIQSINTIARRTFGIHTSALDRDFIHLLRNFSAVDLRRQIDDAFGGTVGGPKLFESAAAPTEPLSVIEVITYRLSQDENDDDAVVAVVATDVTEREFLRRAEEHAETVRGRLMATNQDVLTANAELTEKVAALRTANEDLLVAAEEVQAATEEVETLNEELQASNEELETLNEELQATIEELNTTNDDLQARSVELHEMALSSEAARTDIESVLANISDAVAVTDESGRIILTNPAYERLVHVLGNFTLEDHDGEKLPLDQTPLQRVAQLETFTMSFSVLIADGTRRWYEAEGRPIPRENMVVGLMTICDVTDRSLRHLQDQWMGIASHELRTPLTALQAFLQMASRSLHRDAPDSIRRYIDRSLGQTQRMDNLVAQLLDVTRFQQGRLNLQHTNVELGDVIRQSVDTVEALAPSKTIVVDNALSEAVVLGDEMRLEQVVLNVMMNAVYHAPESDQITVSLKRDGDTFVLTVHDEGLGIPQHLQASIFERFVQVGSSQNPGLGLGLFIARILVLEHGGTIDVESSPDAGTTFTIRLNALVESLAEQA